MAYQYKLLVIDDEQAILTEIKNYFEKRGFSVETALSGEEGLEKLRKQMFEVVLIDLVMPQLSGIDVIKAINEEGISVSSAVITGHGDKEEAIAALQLGAEYWFQKGTAEAEMPNLYRQVKKLAQLIPEDKVDDFMAVLNQKNVA
ncbi:MAG: response regulator [Methyloprofundus sp.]|nr:response regulator [Methyloprofundus sp.]